MRRAASTMRARVCLAVLAALVLGWAGTASAEKKRVGVPKFDGPQEATVRRAVMQVLKGDGYEVVGGKEIDATAKSVGVELDSNDGFKAVAKELAISSFVTGEVAKKKAKLTVRNGADGAVSGEGSFGGANPNKVAADVREAFSRRLGSAVDRGRAPSGAKKPQAPAPEAEEPADDATAAGADDSSKPAGETKTKSEEAPADTSGAAPEETAKKAEAPADESGAVGLRALDVEVGVRGFSRSLTYNQDLYSALRSYKLALGPAVVANLLLFPFAFFTDNFIASNIGVEVNLEQAFGVTSSVPANPNGPFPNGATFNTVIHDYNVGARFRIPFGTGNELSPFVGFGEHAFAFRDGSGSADDRANLSIPDTIYHYVRVGADLRLELPGGLTAGVGAGYRIVLNQGGQIADPGFFPYLTVAGIEADAMLGYHITPSIEARFSVDLRRYFYAMNSDPTDLMQNPPNKIAGGAVDQYVGFTIGAAYVFGAPPPSPKSAEPEAAPAPTKKHKKKKSDDDENNNGDGSDDSGGGKQSGSGDSDE
jgi:hypothetical protein